MNIVGVELRDSLKVAVKAILSWSETIWSGCVCVRPKLGPVLSTVNVILSVPK